ncbi:MAG: DNA repair protein RadA [Bacteroidetes bacterium GWE2_29_8]|nr:MAG: DNA repair protein RadA [Bacteroidetes bacterium GWE2_29_8]OFY18739.1 MAG: DNA repair protein RadA [Bacteroidetes bacterium GWF2_29_10]
MVKIKTAFFCQNCGAQSPKWIGKCPQCGEWNTYVEEVIKTENNSSKFSRSLTPSALPILVENIPEATEHRINTNSEELNRVLGGGLVAGSIVLVGGEPGIGKSTLMLQIALKQKNHKVLYVSGEESLQQIKIRAERIGLKNSSCYILNETKTSNIFEQIEELKPQIIIIDSIQTLVSEKIESPSGSVSQIKECTSELLKYAKETNTPVFLIGHITKEGSIAGPKVLEHIVDTVLYFEGDRNHLFRILRANKNRYGSTSEIGIFEMVNTGLREVINPSEMLVTNHEEQLSGTIIASTVEGLRPILIEVQALVSSAVYGMPQRTSTGFDLRRLNMLLAVLEKRCGFKLATKDVFINIAGGLKVEDPAIDLAVVCAILSSNQDVAVNPKFTFAGEIGLSGEVRPINRIEQRISEAEKLGYEKIFISKYNLKGLDLNTSKIKIVPIKKIENIMPLFF